MHLLTFSFLYPSAAGLLSGESLQELSKMPLTKVVVSPVFFFIVTLRTAAIELAT